MGALFASALAGICLAAASAVAAYRLGARVLYGLGPLIAGMVLAQFLFPPTGPEYVMVLLTPVVIGASAGYTFRAGKPLVFYLTLSALSLTAAFSANYYYLREYRGIDLVEVSRKQVTEMVRAADLPESERTEVLAKMEGALDMIGDIIPFSYFMHSLLLAVFCLVVLRPFFMRRGTRAGEDRTGLAYFKLKDYYVFALIAGWLAALLVDEAGYRAVYVLGLNCALCFSVLYLVQALGIASFFLKKKGAPGFVLPLAVLLLALIGLEALLFVSIILLSIGALDFWADFRKLDVRGEQ
ncbi:MAG: hypothetical protein BWY96_01878 [Spirochaetes bacterium ADurb.BinA120]|nr:MAG: hypothetical protein BWY96_01878 [Spirochaetes bacterium ADurb.BinA120]